jgi:hypothetical protein
VLALKQDGACPVGWVGAAEIEIVVIAQLRGLLRTRKIIVPPDALTGPS